MYDCCQRQALLGIGFAACQDLPEEQRPQGELLLRWFAVANAIAERNQKVTQHCVTICEKLAARGFWTCVLKGQGNLLNYPERLRPYRTSGDIDLWVRPEKQGKLIHRPNRRTVEFVRKIIPNAEARYNHVDFQAFADTEVEMHYRPSFSYFPLHSRRFLRWCEDYRSWQKKEETAFPIVSNDFNVIYQLSHIYIHTCDLGVGLRQLLDYYMVLQAWHGDKAEAIRQITHFGMRRIAGAVMWVLQEVFAMPDNYLLCPADEQEGRFLLHEIMQSGNFGQFDKRYKHSGGKFSRAYEKTRRIMHLVGHYPLEVLSEPFFRIFHWVWRGLRLWRFE